MVEPRAQLPPVDPDFLLVEHRPEALHAYARGLLQHLRLIRAGGKAKGYPIATIKAAAGWLIDSYAEAGIAPAPEAALLVREIIRPNRHASTLPVRRSSEVWRPSSSRPASQAPSAGLVTSLLAAEIEAGRLMPQASTQHERR